MAVRKNEDRFTNFASAVVTETSQTVLTFTELQTGISLGQGIGILIDQIDYFQDSMATLAGSNDLITAAWTTSNAVGTLGVDDGRIIHMDRVQRWDLGTAGNGWVDFAPHVYQFFPPIIIAAPRIYLAVVSASTASPATVKSRLYFRYINLTDREYLELAETFILVG